MAIRCNKAKGATIKAGDHLWAGPKLHYEDAEKNAIFYVISSSTNPGNGCQYVGIAVRNASAKSSIVLVEEK